MKRSAKLAFDVVHKTFACSLLCLIFAIQITFASTICSSNAKDFVYLCNGTEEFCCPEGCCISISLDEKPFPVYNSWYFWVGSGFAFFLFLAAVVVCVLKCYARFAFHRALSWRTSEVNNDDLYRTVQDARGLIRPFLASKQPDTGRGMVVLHSYGAGATDANIDSGLSPLQPAYPPLRPPYTASVTARRNSDQIANIILPPGFIAHDQTT